MPLLDTQVWVEGKTVQYEHFRKPMANPLMMLEISAMPENMKRTVLTQEVVRTLRNTKSSLPWETKVRHLNNFSERMKMSGYSESYRFQVIKSGVQGFDKMQDIENSGGRPINRPRFWEDDQRQKKKESKKKNWFRKGNFDVPVLVPHTPGG